MSKLAKDQASFKSTLARQDYTSWHSQPPPPVSASASRHTSPQSSSAGAPTPNDTTTTKDDGDADWVPPGSKKKRLKHNIVYSQPADTGTGTNVNTQLVYAVSHLKSTLNPMRLQDIAIVTNTPLDTDSVLLNKFKSHDRIHYDPKTDLYSYKHDFTFRSKPALLTEIQRSTRKGGGIPVKALKESWKEAPNAIEELEREGEVLVMRTLKDGALKMVFWNEVNYFRPEWNDPETQEPATAGISGNNPPPSEAKEEENGEKSKEVINQGPPKIVEKEFVELWQSLVVPNEVDLQKQLANEGLKLTSSSTVAPRANAGGTKKKGGKKGGAPRQRQVRITNTHLKGEIDLSRDYWSGGAGPPPAKA